MNFNCCPCLGSSSVQSVTLPKESKDNHRLSNSQNDKTFHSKIHASKHSKLVHAPSLPGAIYSTCARPLLEDPPPLIPRTEKTLLSLALGALEQYTFSVKLDMEGKILEAYGQGMKNILGYRRSELIQHFHYDFIHKEDAKTFTHLIQVSAPTTLQLTASSNSVRWISKKGDFIPLKLASTIPQDEEGNVTYLSKFIINTTFLKKSPTQRLRTLKKEYQEKAKQKEVENYKSFFSSIRHEFGNILNGVLGRSHALSEDVAQLKQIFTTLPPSTLSPSQRTIIETLFKRLSEATDDIVVSGRRGNSYLESIKAFHQYSVGEVVLNKSTFSLRRMLEYLKREAESLIMFNRKGSPPLTQLGSIRRKNQSDIVTIQTLPFPDIYIQTDYSKLLEVLGNLLTNACKFTSQGSITLSATYTETSANKYSLTFTVQDTGIGISEDAIKIIFNPFQQADPSILMKYGGSGLGLSTCKEIISKGFQGEIRVKSQLGVGSTFQVIIEVEKGRESKLRSSSPTSSTQSKIQIDNIAGMRVLVADDNRINRSVIERFLQGFNIKYTIVIDGGPAVDAAIDAIRKNEPYDLIFLDLNMNEMGGWDAAELIRKKERELSGGKFFIRTPIVALTGNNSQEERERSARSGMQGFFTKPYTKETTRNILAKFRKNPTLKWFSANEITTPRQTKEKVAKKDPESLSLLLLKS